MNRLPRFTRRHVVALAVVIGGLTGATMAFVIDRMDPGDRLVWWAPAGTIAVTFAGCMIGLLIGEEIRGGREDALADTAADAAARRPPDH